MLDLYPSPNNGITMCQGNFSLMGADIPTIVRDFGKRKLIHFVHFRNVRGGKFKFEETFHDEGQARSGRITCRPWRKTAMISPVTVRSAVSMRTDTSGD